MYMCVYTCVCGVYKQCFMNRETNTKFWIIYAELLTSICWGKGKRADMDGGGEMGKRELNKTEVLKDCTRM